MHTANQAKCLRTAFRRSSQRREKRTDFSKFPPNTSTATKSCPLCKQAKRTQFQHYLSQCPYLPDEDRPYLSRTRQVTGEQTTFARSDSEPEPDIDPDDELSHHSYRVKSSTNRVSIKQSPHLKVFYNHHAINLTLDTGAETTILAKSPWDITTFFLCFYVLDFMQNYVINPPSSLPHSMLKLECAQATFLFNFQH